MTDSTQRVYSIDIFRALTMLLMVFVNDLWSLTNIPEWMGHARADQDFLGFSDVVFPCFLFIVGMAIPFAIQNRVTVRKESYPVVLQHIALRTAALLVMGFFTVNIESLNPALSGISKSAYQIVMVIAFFLIWNVYPKVSGTRNYLVAGLRIFGALLLLSLFLIYRGGPEGREIMKPGWWGILGLIGWTYGITATLYLFYANSRLGLLFWWLCFVILNIADHANWFKTPIPGGGAFQVFALSGVGASLLLEWISQSNRKELVAPLFMMIGMSFLGIGMGLHTLFIISKIQATPTWVFLCTGIAMLIFALIYWIVDISNKGKFFNAIRPAGTNTLTCYMIPYVWYSIAVYAFSIPPFFKEGILGLYKSFLFALIIIQITGWLDRIKIKLRI